MDFHTFGKPDNSTLLLLPGLGVSHENFLPLVELLKEAFVAKPQAKHLLTLCPEAHVEVFPKMNHGQLLVDHPEEMARRMSSIAEIVAENAE